MFEDSLIESRVAHLAPAKRWTAIASIALQSSVAALLVTLPLLHPERLALRIDAPPILVPFLPKPPVKIEPKQISNATSNATPDAPATAQTASHPLLFPTDPTPGDAPPSTSPINFDMNNNGLPDALRTGGEGRPVKSLRGSNSSPRWTSPSLLRRLYGITGNPHQTCLPSHRQGCGSSGNSRSRSSHLTHRHNREPARRQRPADAPRGSNGGYPNRSLSAL